MRNILVRSEKTIAELLEEFFEVGYSVGSVFGNLGFISFFVINM